MQLERYDEANNDAAPVTRVEFERHKRRARGVPPDPGVAAGFHKKNVSRMSSLQYFDLFSQVCARSCSWCNCKFAPGRSRPARLLKQVLRQANTS